MSTRLDFLDLDNVRANFLQVTYPNATTEVYTFRKNSSTDPIVLQLTITYTDSTKELIDSVQRNTPSNLG